MELCGAVDPEHGWLCTRAKDHRGQHIASIGPYQGAETPVLSMWPQKPHQFCTAVRSSVATED